MRVAVVVPALIGALSGVGAMLLFRSAQAPLPAAPRLADPRPIVVAAPDHRVDVLEAQVRSLQTARADSPQAGSAQPAAPIAPAPDSPQVAESRQASAERFAREFESRLDARSSEPRNSAWAAAKEASISRELPRLGAAAHESFSLVNVDCRTTTCVARLEWPSEQTARNELPQLLRSTGDLGCANQIAFPPGSGEPYRASLLFDCAPPPPAPAR
jgi:hypothetical protein